MPSVRAGKTLPKQNREKVGGGPLQVLLSLEFFLPFEVKIDQFVTLPTPLTSKISGLPNLKLPHQQLGQRKPKGSIHTLLELDWALLYSLASPSGAWALACPQSSWNVMCSH